MRSIEFCQIEESDTFQGDFFPKQSYVLKVRGKGFLRYQVRLMMGALIELGAGQSSLETIQGSLIEKEKRKIIGTIAPGSGLQLYRVIFKDLDNSLE